MTRVCDASAVCRWEEVSAFLDHSSLAVTTVYLRRLEGQQDGTWPAVAAAIGE